MSEKKSIGQVDLLHGPIFKNLVIFMIPIFISYLFQQLYNAVDTAIVGHVLGEASLASIGACASIFEMMVGFALSLGGGFAIVISRAFGSGDEAAIKKAVAGSIVIGLMTSVAITILCIFGLGPLLKLINTPDAIFNESLRYISIIGIFVSVMFIYNLASGILRAIGNSVMPLVFLVFSSLLNIFLDYAFIAWFGMGVAGAAYATVISQGISAILCVLYIFLKVKILVPEARHFAFDKEMYLDLAGQGYAMAIMGSIVSVGSIILQSGINSLGQEIIAGHVAARKAYALFNLPFISMGIAVSTFIGQNKGANQGKRILQALRDAFIYDIIGAGFITILLFFTAPSIIKLISGSSNPVILENGAKYLRVVGPFYAVLGILVQLRMSLQGVGAKVIPIISSVIECVGKIVFNFVFIPMFGYAAVIWCEPLIWCLMTMQLYYAYRTNAYFKSIRKEN
ncbi:MAG: MATE family efflux transporter [Holdemanella sp.]|nr:MATE family efflux transporter [Holdemanella sp.]